MAVGGGNSAGVVLQHALSSHIHLQSVGVGWPRGAADTRRDPAASASFHCSGSVSYGKPPTWSVSKQAAEHSAHQQQPWQQQQQQYYLIKEAQQWG